MPVARSVLGGHAAWVLAVAFGMSLAYELWRSIAKTGTSRHDSMRVFVTQGIVIYVAAAGVTYMLGLAAVGESDQALAEYERASKLAAGLSDPDDREIVENELRPQPRVGLIRVAPPGGYDAGRGCLAEKASSTPVAAGSERTR